MDVSQGVAKLRIDDAVAPQAQAAAPACVNTLPVLFNLRQYLVTAVSDMVYGYYEERVQQVQAALLQHGVQHPSMHYVLPVLTRAQGGPFEREVAQIANLIREKFPFLAISENLRNQALAYSGDNNYPKPSEVLYNMIPDSRRIVGFQLLVDAMEAPHVAETLSMLYRNGQMQAFLTQVARAFHLYLPVPLLPVPLVPAGELSEKQLIALLQGHFTGDALLQRDDQALRRLIELVLFGVPIGEVSFLLAKVVPDIANFCNTVMQALLVYSFDEWENKERVVIHFFCLLTKPGRQQVAEALKGSNDAKTAALGVHFAALFQTTVYREKVPHLNALKALLPSLHDYHYRSLFNCDCFPPFIRPYLRDEVVPKTVTRLNFTNARRVIAYGSLIIGVYEQSIGGGKWRSYLLAYDKDSHEMRWGEELSTVCGQKDDKELLSWSVSSVGIVLLFAHTKKLTILDPATGTPKGDIQLPAEPHARRNPLAITASGFYFLESSRKLYGGSLHDASVQPFEIDRMARGGTLEGAVGEYALIELSFDEGKMLVDKTGKSHLFTYEQILEKKGLCYALEHSKNEEKANDENSTILVWSSVESMIGKERPLHTIVVKGERLRLRRVTDDGTCICSNSKSESTYFFIDSNLQKPIPRKIPSFGKVYIDERQTAIFAWDEVTNEFWKYTKEKIEGVNLGTLTSGKGTSLLHVDERDQLYFVDRHY